MVSVELPPTTGEAAAVAAPRRTSKLLLVLGVIAGLIIVSFVGLLVLSGMVGSPPMVHSLVTAHGLEGDSVIGETRVFDVGEEVFLIFRVENGQSGHRALVQINHDGEQVDAAGLVYNLTNWDAGNRALTFSPETEGVYTATLHLDGQPVENTQVSFKVIAGGPRLQEVQVARAVDPETFQPAEVATRFDAQDTVYITYRAVGTRPGDKVHIQYYIDDLLQPSDPFDTVEFNAVDTVRGHFSLQGGAPQALWAGRYRAELFYNDDLVAVVHFRVESGQE